MMNGIFFLFFYFAWAFERLNLRNRIVTGCQITDLSGWTELKNGSELSDGFELRLILAIFVQNSY